MSTIASAAALQWDLLHSQLAVGLDDFGPARRNCADIRYPALGLEALTDASQGKQRALTPACQASTVQPQLRYHSSQASVGTGGYCGTAGLHNTCNESKIHSYLTLPPQFAFDPADTGNKSSRQSQPPAHRLQLRRLPVAFPVARTLRLARLGLTASGLSPSCERQRCPDVHRRPQLPLNEDGGPAADEPETPKPRRLTIGSRGSKSRPSPFRLPYECGYD
uniref:Uncharacterized protein n=1 Tax=Macrostomum lignano TaxID=282301 RepID=A0A1I8FG84_9PLAT